MNTLLDSIKNYLEMNTTGALMVSGEWGCGKTYHIDKVVIPALRDDGYNPVKVSLFGIESVKEIPLRIAENYKSPDNGKEDKRGNLFNRNKSKAIAKGAQLVSSIKWLENFIDVKSLVNSNSGLLFTLIPSRKTVIFLDDIERVIDTIDIHTLLGFINGMVEQRGYKVIVIANNSYIQEKATSKLVFKEKVIEKTLVYEPDVVEIFRNLYSDSKYSESFKAFIAQPKVQEVIDPSFPTYHKDKELLADLHNIRILKHNLSHFNKVFEICKTFIEGDDKTISDTFLLSLWACTVGISIEYKKNRLTYGDREPFIKYVDFSLIDIDFSVAKTEEEDLFNDEENNETDKQKRELVQKRISHIFNKIVKAHNLPQIVSPQLFDFITAGISLNAEGMKAIWEDHKAEIKRNTASPSYALLQKIMKAQWEMSNDEMVEALKELLHYVEAGAFSDNIAYVNAATYLQRFNQLIGISHADAEKAIKVGIDRMYVDRKSLNILDKKSIDVLEDQIPKISQWVIDYEKKKMATVMEVSQKSGIDEACHQFNEDLPALVGRMTIHYGQTPTPDFINYPILKHIPESDIIKKVNSIQPKEVMALLDLIQSRFQEMKNESVYNEEIVFVRTLERAIEQRKPERKVYADYLIEYSLLPSIKKIQNTL